MEVCEVNQKAIKHSKKPGENVFDGLLEDRPVTMVQEDANNIIERIFSEDHILRYLAHTSNGYSIKDYYACSLRVFLKAKKENYDINLVDVLKETNLLNPDWKTNGYRHTQDAVNILRDVLKACAELRCHGFDHGNLTTENIVLCIVLGRIRAKVTRLKRVPADYTDYSSLANLIEELFSTPKENGQSYMSNEALDLWYHVKQMTVPNSKIDQVQWRQFQKTSETEFLRDPRTLFKQPLFWHDEMYLTFIVKMRGVFKRCHMTRYYERPQIQSFLNDIQDIGQADWFIELQNDAVTAELYEDLAQTTSIYDKTKTEDLLRFIRNMFSHFEEKEDDFKVAVGDIPHGFFEFFRRRYPNLFLETRRVLIFHLENLQEFADITCAFGDYI